MMRKWLLLVLCASPVTILCEELPIERPTMEQLMDSDTIIISYRLKKIDRNNFDKAHWKISATQVNDLIDLCYATEKGKNDAVFQEIYRILEIIRPKDDEEPHQGIQGNLEVILTSEENLHVKPPKFAFQGCDDF